MNADQIARIAHEVNRAYCHAIGDESQPSWGDAPGWQKDSAIEGVRNHLAQELTPEQSHEAWFDHKVVEGWIHGDMKDPEKKTHPCLVPYSRLPQEQRVKDYLFAAVVREMRGL